MTTLTDELFHSLPAIGWLSLAEAELLYRAAQEVEGPILEVGCYHGRSTCLLASLGRTVYAVDPFRGFDSDDPTGIKTLTAFRRNLEQRRLLNVNYWAAPIEGWAYQRVRFAYLDGDHTYQGTINQVNAAIECGAKVIAIHDVNDDGEGVEIKRACLELLGPWSERVERLAVWRLK